MTLNILKNRLLILIFCSFVFISCNEKLSRTQFLSKDSSLIGKYKTEYIIHYSSYRNPEYTIYSDKEIYTCSFQGTNFLLEKDNTEEILSTTAPIQIVKSEIVK